MKKVLTCQKGFAPILIIIIVIYLVTASIFIVYYFKNPSAFGQRPVSVASSSAVVATPSAKISPIPTRKAAVSTKVNSTSAPVPTQKTSLAPTAAPAFVDNSCSYDLSGPTGAIDVKIKPQSNQVVGDQIVELQAKAGCKVLDGRSTDKQVMIARAGGNGYSAQNTVTYSTVPAGSYSVRIQYKGQWTGYNSVNVVPIKLSSVEFTVEGSVPPPTPTPTPIPKTICQVSIVSKTSEKAPATVNLAAGASGKVPANLADKYITAVQWDYNGDGSWDTEMSSSLEGIVSKEFTQPGSYTVKARVQLSDGEVTDTCSNSFSLN